jgi:uridine kinase
MKVARLPKCGRTTATQVESAVNRIVDLRRHTSGFRSVLVAVSGIDASGKGHVAAEMIAALRARGLRIAGLSADAWLNLPHVRFAVSRPAEHFYRHAVRFEEMFEQLVLPLRDRRSLRLEADLTEETAREYRKHSYEFEDVDVVVLEGIFLLKCAFQPRYDLSLWIDCTFETALVRAIARGQEGLSRDETVRAYRSIYFPAQRIHLARDRPRAAATAVIQNAWRPTGRIEAPGASQG